jgi:hypothetical protein
MYNYSMGMCTYATRLQAIYGDLSLDLALDPGIRAGTVKSISEGCGYGIIESLMQFLVDGTDLRP